MADLSIPEAIDSVSANTGADIGGDVDKLRCLLDERGLMAHLSLVGSLSPFDKSLSSQLLKSGGDLYKHLSDKPSRSEVAAILAGMARVKWSAAASAIKHLPSMEGKSGSFIILWLRRGESLASVDQDVAIEYFGTSAAMCEIIGPERVDLWASLGQEIAEKSWKAAREYFRASPAVAGKIEYRDIERWARLGLHLLENSPKVKASYDAHSLFAIGAGAGKSKTINLSVEYFKSAAQILGRLSLNDLEAWVAEGLETANAENSRGIAFFSLRTGASRRSMDKLVKGLELKEIRTILSSYALALFDREIHLRTPGAFYRNIPGLNRFISFTDGVRVFLPASITLFKDPSLNTKTYKWLLAHELAHLSYGTFAVSSADLKELPETDIPMFAFRLFEFLEDERVDVLLTAEYPGLEKDRRILIEEYLKQDAGDGDVNASVFELCSFSSLPGFGRYSAPEFFPAGFLKEELALVRSGGLSAHDVLALSVQACSSIDMASLNPFLRDRRSLHRVFYRGMLDFGFVEETRTGMAKMVAMMSEKLLDCREITATPALVEQALLHLEEAQGLDSSELFWQITEADRIEELFERMKVTIVEMEEEGRFRRAVYYDEWDCKMDDYKKDWCRVREMDMPEISRATYDNTVKEYYGMVSVLKRQFGLLRPDRIKRHFREERGDDLDFDALVETLVEHRAGIAPSDKIYIRRDKKMRDVSVAFLADMSFSTSDVLPSGKRIIDVERDGLVLMAEALESIGDRWAVYGFSTDYREKVDFFVVKDFNENFGTRVKMRYDGIRPIGLTRLGAAIRHANSLLQRQDSLIRLLILLSDGRPYDVDYGDMEYSIEDTRTALWEGRRKGINSFCITVDKKSSDYLPHMYGEANYAVIENVDALPVTLPLIYKKLTT